MLQVSFSVPFSVHRGSVTRYVTRKMEKLPFVAPAAVAELSVHALLDNSCFHLLHCFMQMLDCATHSGRGVSLFVLRDFLHPVLIGT